MNLLENKELIDKRAMHIATVNEDNRPNLSVASDVLVIAEDKIVISHNEMVNTPKNILIYVKIHFLEMVKSLLLVQQSHREQ